MKNSKRVLFGCWFCIYKADMVLTARYEPWSKQYIDMVGRMMCT